MSIFVVVIVHRDRAKKSDRRRLTLGEMIDDRRRRRDGPDLGNRRRGFICTSLEQRSHYTSEGNEKLDR